MGVGMLQAMKTGVTGQWYAGMIPKVWLACQELQGSGRGWPGSRPQLAGGGRGRRWVGCLPAPKLGSEPTASSCRLMPPPPVWHTSELCTSHLVLNVPGPEGWFKLCRTESAVLPKRVLTLALQSSIEVRAHV